MLDFAGIRSVEVKLEKIEIVTKIGENKQPYTERELTIESVNVSKNAFIAWLKLVEKPEIGWDDLLKHVATFNKSYADPAHAAKNLDSSIFYLLRDGIISSAQVIANDLVQGPVTKRFLDDRQAQIDKVEKERRKFDAEIAELHARKAALNAHEDDAGQTKDKLRKKPGKE